MLPLKPRRASVDPALLAVSAASDVISTANLFGRTLVSASLPVLGGATFSNLKLHGVFAAVGSLPAFAIMSVDGKLDQPVKKGVEIVPGVLLAKVYPDYVEVSRSGALERVNLEGKAGGPNGATKEVGFRLNVQTQSTGNFSFSRNELNQALQDPKQLANLGKFVARSAGAGMAVEDAPRNSLAEKLGLQRGDVILRLNGQPVSSNEDISRFYQQMSQTGQVNLALLRSGSPQQLNYAVK